MSGIDEGRLDKPMGEACLLLYLFIHKNCNIIVGSSLNAMVYVNVGFSFVSIFANPILPIFYLIF
jgi:hypothetical protein